MAPIHTAQRSSQICSFGLASFAKSRGQSRIWRGEIKTAILSVIDDAPTQNSFTCLTRPVWNGWVSSQSVLWRLPHSLTEGRYAYASPHLRDNEAGCFVSELMLELASEQELEKRLYLPLRHNPNPEVATEQDWEFRRPGFEGCCYWDSSRPLSLAPTDNWQEMVNERHLALLQESLDGDPTHVPLYVLARIERYRLHKTHRRVLLQ